MTVALSQKYYLVFVSIISCFFAFAHRDISNLDVSILEIPIQEIPKQGILGREILTDIFDVTLSQDQSFEKNIRPGMRATSGSSLSYNNHAYYKYYRAYYASMSPVDFYHAFEGVSDAREILGNYPLYAFPNFITLERHDNGSAESGAFIYQ